MRARSVNPKPGGGSSAETESRRRRGRDAFSSAETSRRYSPLVDENTGELDVKGAYPDWDPARHYVVTVLTFLKKIFYVKDGFEARAAGAGNIRRGTTSVSADSRGVGLPAVASSCGGGVLLKKPDPTVSARGRSTRRSAASPRRVFGRSTGRYGKPANVAAARAYASDAPAFLREVEACVKESNDAVAARGGDGLRFGGEPAAADGLRAFLGEGPDVGRSAEEILRFLGGGDGSSG